MVPLIAGFPGWAELHAPKHLCAHSRPPGGISGQNRRADGADALIGGDLNCCLGPEKDRFHRGAAHCHHTRNTGERARLRLEDLLEGCHVRDIWRSINREVSQFSFRRGAYASRLDYWFISEHLSELATESSRILWRFDNRLPQDPNFWADMATFLKDYSCDPEISAPHVKWDFLKHEIRNFTLTTHVEPRIWSQLGGAFHGTEKGHNQLNP